MQFDLTNGKLTFLAAKQAKSPAGVVGKLVEYGFSSSAETSAFAEDIFSRVPRKESGLNVSSYSKSNECIDSGFSTPVLSVYEIMPFLIVTIVCYVYQQYQKQEKEAAMLVRKQQTYALLDADDDDNDDGGRSSVPVVSESRKPDSHKKRFRKKGLSQEDEDDEVKPLNFCNIIFCFCFSG